MDELLTGMTITVVRDGDAEAAVDVDVERRLLRSARIASRDLAEDGMVVLPDGIAVAEFAKNPQVLESHRAPAVGRSLEQSINGDFLFATTEFADTARGREYAYLYGVNADRRTYMRAWSVRADVLAAKPVDWASVTSYARKVPGDIAARMRRQGVRPVVVQQSLLREYSVVALGADREALTRAVGGGVALAGELLTNMDLEEARRGLDELRQSNATLAGRLDALEREIEALRSDGAAAAVRGDSAEILAKVTALTERYTTGRKG